MNRINKNNYEVYFLDYHEGNLNSEEKELLMAFLRENPEFYDEFEDFNGITLPVPELTYPYKSDLFKSEVSIPEANEWEYRCIAYIEGDLSVEEQEIFETELNSNPEKAQVLELYMATVSMPDENILFEGKTDLKKKVVLIPRWIYGAVSAAAILVLAWIIFLPGGENPEDPRLADGNSREVIYIDKISHPGDQERIASVNMDSKQLSKSSYLFQDNPELSQTNDSSGKNPVTRETIIMAALSSQKVTPVELGSNITPPSSDMFAFRTIPAVEDEEYQTLLAFSGDFIRKQLLDQDPDLVEKSKFSLWELADAGLEKVSNVFGTNADIEREYSESGELLAVSFESALVGFNTPIKRRSSAQID